MSLKQALIVLSIFLAIIVAITVFSMPEEQAKAIPALPYSFSVFVQDSGLLDSNNATAIRAFVEIDLKSESAKNSSAELVLLPSAPFTDIYEVNDYPYDRKKIAIMSALRSNISEYGSLIGDLALEDTIHKKGSVIILPSNAMPDSLSSGGLLNLINGNAVIYFGKSLDFSIDKTGSQSLASSELFDDLNLTFNENAITPKYNGPKSFDYGNATVLEYPQGWLIIYEDASDPEIADEITYLIIHQAWQSKSLRDIYPLPSSYNGTMTLFSGQASGVRLYPRMIFRSSSINSSKISLIDLKPIDKLNGTLKLPEIAGSDRELPYNFELHDNLTYPMNYDLSFLIKKDGEIADTQKAKIVTMKTLAVESGSFRPNFSSGSYTISLVNQYGTTLAMAYTHVPEVQLRLFRIEGFEHFFNVTVDGVPAANKKLFLRVNNESEFTIHTDKAGQASVAFGLAPGLYTFRAEIEGEVGSAYYMKPGDDSGLFYPFLFAGAILALGIYALRSKTKRKLSIRTYHRPSPESKNIKITFDVFMDLFKKTQNHRAKGLPLSVSDLRMGIRKHAVFKGTPVFITDSNIYHVLDLLVKKGRFLSYDGYFLPESMSNGKPIEYWVLKRKLMDYSIERGGNISSAKGADFVVKGRMIHIWGDLDPSALVRLCKKSDNVIIFPDSKRKEEFSKKAAQYDPAWMHVLLEISHGRIYCQTLDEFLERGSNGKA